MNTNHKTFQRALPFYRETVADCRCQGLDLWPLEGYAYPNQTHSKFLCPEETNPGFPLKSDKNKTISRDDGGSNLYTNKSVIEVRGCAWQISQLRLSLGESVVSAESCCHRASGAVNGHVCDCTAVRPCHRGQSGVRDTLSSPCQMMGPGQPRKRAKHFLNNCKITDEQVLWEYVQHKLNANFQTGMPAIHQVLHIIRSCLLNIMGIMLSAINMNVILSSQSNSIPHHSADFDLDLMDFR